MPPFKNKPARKSETDSAISLFKSGTRNLLIPLFEARNVYFNHPLDRTSVRISTQSGPQWDAMVTEVKNLGLLPRLAEELDELALSIPADAEKWAAIAAAFRLANAADLPAKKDENRE